MYRKTGSDELTRSGVDWLKQVLQPGLKPRLAQLRYLGWRGCWQRVSFFFRLARVHLWNKCFDWRRGTDTAAGVSHWDLQMPAEAQRGASWYTPVPVASVTSVLDSLNLNYSEHQFIDLGAGKGKVLLAVSSYPFKSICGIELDPRLANICRSNLARVGRDLNPQQLLEMDLLDWEPPTGPCFLFAYSPFSRLGLQRFLGKLDEWSAASPGQLTLFFVDDAGEQSLLPDVIAHCEANKDWEKLAIPPLPRDCAALFPVEVAVFRALPVHEAC